MTIRYHGPGGDVNDVAAQAAVAQLAAIRAAQNPPVALYTDGGVIGPNPSARGGTWAWCMVDETGQRGRHAFGRITPQELGAPVVSNNHTELLALVLGLEALPDGWSGTVYSDSWVTLQRVFLAAKLKNVPDWLVERLQVLQRSQKLANISYVLLGGHPNKAELASGVRADGKPVSIHNVWCDQMCTKIAREVVSQ